VDDPRLSGTVVGGDVLVPVVAASDVLARAEIDPAKLAGRPFVFRERGSATSRAVEEGLAMAGVKPLVAMEPGSNAAVAGAVAAGAGPDQAASIWLRASPPTPHQRPRSSHRELRIASSAPRTASGSHVITAA
jgi:DNA-binding transcriptional LysR family regulator